MRKINILLSVAFLLCLVSCATTISTQVMRPAELDLNGAKTLAILPFQPNPWNNQIFDVLDLFISPTNENIEKRRICDEITENLTMSFIDTDYMQLISSNAVQSALRTGKKTPCDVYLSGYIKYYNEDIDRTEYEKNDKIYVYYRKQVDVVIVYEIIDSKTNRILAHKVKELSQISPEEKRKVDLPSGYDIIRRELNVLVNEIKRQIQPYYISITFRLLEDKTKDSQIQSAHELAKNKNLVEAQKVFLDAYDRTGNFECAYNAGLLSEAMCRYDEAAEMMLDLYNKTYDRRAMKALEDIKREKLYAEKLNAQRNARKD